MNQFRTVFIFEYFGYLKNKSFIILTVVLSALALIVPSIPVLTGVIGGLGVFGSEKNAVVCDGSGRYDEDAAAGYFTNYQIEISNDLPGALAKLQDGECDFVLEIDGLEFILHVSGVNLSSFDLMSEAERMIRNAAQIDFLSEMGFTDRDVSDYMSITPSGAISAVGGADENAYFTNTVYAYFLIMLLYITLLLYGQFIVTSVVSEKSSKAMEILITSVRPVYLMFGKVIGVAAAGLTQFAIFFACGAASLAVNGMLLANLYSGALTDASVSSELIAMVGSPVSPVIFFYLIVFFLLGFMLYAFLYAALASTVSRMEDANSVVVPPMLLIVGAFFVSIFGLADSGSAWVKALSFFPFFTPMTMFMRVCMGSAGNAEALASIAVLAVSIFVCGYFGAKIYRLGVLMYGKPPKPAEIVRMMVKAKVF